MSFCKPSLKLVKISETYLPLHLQRFPLRQRGRHDTGLFRYCDGVETWLRCRRLTHGEAESDGRKDGGNSSSTHGPSPFIGHEKKVMQHLLLQGQSEVSLFKCGFQHSFYEVVDDDIFGIGGDI